MKMSLALRNGYVLCIRQHILLNNIILLLSQITLCSEVPKEPDPDCQRHERKRDCEPEEQTCISLQRERTILVSDVMDEPHLKKSGRESWRKKEKGNQSDDSHSLRFDNRPGSHLAHEVGILYRCNISELRGLAWLRNKQRAFLAYRSARLIQPLRDELDLVLDKMELSHGILNPLLECLILGISVILKLGFPPSILVKSCSKRLDIVL